MLADDGLDENLRHYFGGLLLSWDGNREASEQVDDRHDVTEIFGGRKGTNEIHGDCVPRRPGVVHSGVKALCILALGFHVVANITPLDVRSDFVVHPFPVVAGRYFPIRPCDSEVSAERGVVKQLDDADTLEFREDCSPVSGGEERAGGAIRELGEVENRGIGVHDVGSHTTDECLLIVCR